MPGTSNTPPREELYCPPVTDVLARVQETPSNQTYWSISICVLHEASAEFRLASFKLSFLCLMSEFSYSNCLVYSRDTYYHATPAHPWTAAHAHAFFSNTNAQDLSLDGVLRPIQYKGETNTKKQETWYTEVTPLHVVVQNEV